MKNRLWSLLLVNTTHYICHTPVAQCSKPCGGGQRSRKVLCMLNNETVPALQCDLNDILFGNEDCNNNPCGTGNTSQHLGRSMVVGQNTVSLGGKGKVLRARVCWDLPKVPLKTKERSFGTFITGIMISFVSFFLVTVHVLSWTLEGHTNKNNHPFKFL